MAERDDEDKPERDACRDPRRDLAGALHDVSNALTVLLGWVGEARAADAPPEAIRQALTIIEQRARIARDLARQAIGGVRIDEPTAVSTIVDDAVRALAVEAGRAGVGLVVRGGAGEATVAAALDVSQVLTNLLMNALAHAPRQTEVTVDVSVDDEEVALVVADRGPGVPAQLEDDIFRGASRRPGGTGVGLRHSRDLARAAGGDVELLHTSADTSAGGGPGARFRMCWPRADALPRPPVSSPFRPRALAGVRVLVVEDDVAVTQLLETALEARGAEVRVASTTADLASALTKSPYDAALVDLSPIADDIAGALARLRTSSPDIDLVLITGSADRLPEAVATEKMTLVRKPFELAEILAVLTSSKRA